MPSRARDAFRHGARRGSGAARKLARALSRVEVKLTSAEALAAQAERDVGRAMRDHDMVEAPDEAYYRDRYWAWIEAELDRAGVPGDARLLDAGCGSGRLLVPLAARVAAAGGTVVGVDFLPDSLANARRHAQAARVTNFELVEGDLLTRLRERETGEFGAALFLEVGFVLPDLDATLTELARVIRPGGLLLGSFRAQFFWLLMGALRRDPDLLDTARRQTSGVLPGAGFQNWSDAGQTRAALERAGFGGVRLHGVGALSGIEGDPLAAIVRPSELGDSGRAALARAEDALAVTHPDIGRYVLASATRSGG
jgi:SAM-dependent methyltransferase